VQKSLTFISFEESYEERRESLSDNTVNLHQTKRRRVFGKDERVGATKPSTQSDDMIIPPKRGKRSLIIPKVYE